MTPRGTRTLRVGLLGLVAAVVVAVLWNLRARPVAAPGPSPTPASGTAPTGTTSTGLVLRNFRAGEERFVIRAKASQGQEKDGLKLQGVEVTFPYLAQGKTASATIVADECLCEPEARRAAFRGHVKVTTDDGLELESEALDYAGDSGAAQSDQNVRFKRGKVSGTAKGARYGAQDQRLELLADVRIRIEEDGKPPTDIQAGHAVAQRSDDTMDFSDGVAVKKGADTLEAAELSLGFIGAFDVVTRAVAKDDVKVQTGDNTLLPAARANPAGKGARRLFCRKLDIGFRPDRTLEQAVASGGHDDAGTSLYAELELPPAPGGSADRRKLQARVIVFRFDGKGQLAGLEGQLGTILTSEPTRAKGTPPRTARSENLTAFMEPASGALKTVDFKDGVEFEQARQRASARRAHYDGVKETLFLTDEAHVLDEEQGSDLRADAIDLGTRKETVAARGSVRHTLAAKGPVSKEGLLSREEPAVFLARFFDYDGASKTGRYRENALLRSGRDEVRAPLLVVEQPAPGQRRLTGSGGVGSTLHPRPQKDAQKPPEVVETRSEEMAYDEAKSTVTYKGDVWIRQGDIQTKSPEAVLTLTADGQTIESLVAGEPVEVQQGTRKAKGTKGTYTPRTETFVLVGPKVEVQDPNRRVEGRILTFQVGDDRIRMDGQEEVRTEAVFKREPPKREPVRREPPKN
jgi:LPS export ABC transporter protein LptC/lipopolysaccharide transport protein LptA